MPDNKTVYVLGAGFTRAIIDKAPLNDDIMNHLDAGLFPYFIDEFEVAKPNIEHFLTLVDLKCLRLQEKSKIKSDEFEAARQQIIESILGMFDIDKLSVSSLEDKPDLKKFVASVPDDSYLISLNYDCVLDQGLWLDGRWHPGDGYYLEVEEMPSGGETKLFLLKLHGSCNFSSGFPDNDHFVIGIHEELFPGVGNNINTPLHNPRIIAMSFIKNYKKDLMKLWRKAISEIANADHLVIIGCSIREEDAFLKFALSHFGMKEKNDNNNFNISIVGFGSKDVKGIESRVTQLVACPHQQKINLYSGGLAGYLDCIRNN